MDVNLEKYVSFKILIWTSDYQWLSPSGRIILKRELFCLKIERWLPMARGGEIGISVTEFQFCKMKKFRRSVAQQCEYT